MKSPFSFQGPDAAGTIFLKGELNAFTAPDRTLIPGILKSGKKKVTLDLRELDSLDLNGAAILLDIENKLKSMGIISDVINLPPTLEPIWNLSQETSESIPETEPKESYGFIESTGKAVVDLFKDAHQLISFYGEVTLYLFKLILRPWTGRWQLTLKITEKSVVNALPVTALVAFLVGLILAFQSAMVMQLFGVDIFVADLVGIAIIRELGSLLTAIVLTGRSGSAFSSELASMKSNQEIDAMVTMGLSPVRDLALPRIVSMTLSTPLLTVLADMAGLLGGNVVMMAIGHPFAVFWKELFEHVDISDILTGFFKSFVFGFTVALIGCQRGLYAKDGPSAVGEATTLGVVSNIICIAVLDSLFAVVFYVLNW
ncbi:MAG: ABC transporter permease [Deltaproteobacteria bacterium]|jgi:phospholipid/cholesterol/gamma-HCH transport system permease protein|nr:ABC transporter permease [Deltaproteobacteria bacterium]